MIKARIETAIKAALTSLAIPLPREMQLEHPTDLAHGDYSTNVALLTKVQAEKIKAELEKNLPSEVAKVEVAGPGFINFYLDGDFFAASVKKVLEQKENFGKNDSKFGQKIIVEYTDPNPFKEFHIGHLMSNAIGEAIARLIEWSGAEVKRVCYQGDVGLHVAKAIWAARKFGLPLSTGQAYARGEAAYEADETARQEIIAINKKIYTRSDPEINKLYEAGKKESLEFFEVIYQKLGTRFDHFFFESEASPVGQKIVQENLGRVFEKSDGAIVFRAERHDPSLHTRVFINTEGLPTYEAKELGLAKMKHDYYPGDQSIVITGNEIDQYFKVLLQALKLIYPELAEKTKHLSHGMLRLPSGKMSSRTGEVITAEDLIAECKKTREGITDAIAVGAIKYSILKQDTRRDIVFDFDKSLAFVGHSGPYLQYTFARTQSVLAKTLSRVPLDNVDNAELPTSVERLLYRFPAVVERAAREYAPHYVCAYLYELASAFNNYYQDRQIVSDEPHSPYRVALTAAVGQVIKNGLTLLGIQAPAKM